MGFFDSLIKEAHNNTKKDVRNAHIIFPIQRAYLKVKSKYRGLEGKIYCVRYADGYTWWATRKAWRKAMDKLAYRGGDYLVLNDKRASKIIIDDEKGTVKGVIK